MTLILLAVLFSHYLYTTWAYTNPIVPKESADPWVILNSGNYYYTHTTGGSVTVWQSPRLESVAQGRMVNLYVANGNQPIKSDIWAPELWLLDGEWMVYATGNTVGDISKGIQQIFALRATTSNPLGPYTYAGLLLGPGTPSLDATVLVSNTDQKFIVWSQWEAEGQCLWIGPLNSDKASVGQPRVRISCPDQPWERIGSPVNEGPEVLKNGNVTHIIYSASFCGTPDYCLGMLTNVDGNFLNAASWVKTTSGPVFRRSDSNKVWGVGHCSFTKSKDDKEFWIAYHGMDDPNGGEPDRSTRIQQFGWSGTNPNFGVPLPAGVPYPDPSGEYIFEGSNDLALRDKKSSVVYDVASARTIARTTSRNKFI